MENKPFLNIEELHALAPGTTEELGPEFDKKTKNIDKFLKEFHYYEHCNVKSGEKCEHPYCAKVMLEFKNGKGVGFKCGRDS